VVTSWLESQKGVKDMRILIADNDPRVRSALRVLLRQEPGLTIHESADLTSLAAEVQVFRPDMVLLDWELPGRPAAALLMAMARLETRPKVIVLSQRPESEEEALGAGADAFVSKTEPPEQLLAAMRSLIGGEVSTCGQVGAVTTG
jgi:DNA-binding NarL/FixJ family response regulator